MLGRKEKKKEKLIAPVGDKLKEVQLNVYAGGATSRLKRDACEDVRWVFQKNQRKNRGILPCSNRCSDWRTLREGRSRGSRRGSETVAHGNFKEGEALSHCVTMLHKERRLKMIKGRLHV